MHPGLVFINLLKMTVWTKRRFRSIYEQNVAEMEYDTEKYVFMSVCSPEKEMLRFPCLRMNSMPTEGQRV